MNPDQMRDFESQLHTDPVLNSEFELQQDIVNSVKDFRKSQLKARLDQVPVSVSPTGIVGVKTAALIVLTGIIGLGTYLFLDQQSAETSPEAITELVAEETPSLEVQPPANDTQTAEDLTSLSEEATTAEDTNTETVTDEVITPAEQLPAPQTTTSAKANVEKAKEVTKEEVSTPTVNSPEIFDPSIEDNTEETLEIPTPELGETEVAESPVLAVETSTEDNGQLFHYQYYSGKLYLYGDFTDNPYEIIELNSASGKKLFMFYNDNYYRIFDNQVDLTPLQAVQESGHHQRIEHNQGE